MIIIYVLVNSSQPELELTTTARNSNIITSTKIIHLKPAPNPELDFEELQLTKLNPHRLIHLKIERNIVGLLQLLLNSIHQTTCIRCLTS